MELAEKIAEAVGELAAMEDPQERFGYLIDAARDRPPLPDDLKIEAFRIQGCQSQLWLVPRFDQGRCQFSVDSDALITKGVAGLLAELYSDALPAEILAHEPTFLSEVGITQHLTPNRRNGLSNVWTRIRSFAEACLNPAT